MSQNRPQLTLSLVMLLAVASVGATSAHAQNDEKKTQGKPSSKPASTAEEQIRASADKFVAAFNRHDTAALAKMWMPDGEYINEDGWRFVGREAIEKEYAQFFDAHDGVKLRVAIDSIRVLTPTTAIEDGRTALEPQPEGAPAMSRYTAFHVKQDDGTWLLASVRDSRIESETTYDQLRDLEWLVGDWTAERGGVETDLSCRWIGNKSFLERRFTTEQDGHEVASSLEIIGWDSVSGRIVSWNFSDGGGRTVGIWSLAAQGHWLVRDKGVTPDASTTTSVSEWTQLAGGALGYRSTDRSIDGVAVPDGPALVFKPQDNSKTGEKSSPRSNLH